MATETLRIIIESKATGAGAQASSKGLKDITKDAEKTAKSLDATSKGAGLLEKALLKATAAFSVIAVARFTGQMFKLGTEVEAAEHRFEAFAGGADKAREYLAAFNQGAVYSVDRMGAMTGAAKMLQMGLVGNSDEMKTMAAIAVRLGDQTKDTSARIGDFAALLANRSIPRLDNFGIASAKVRERLAELKKAGYDADQAFKLAVIEQGTISLDKLGDSADLTKTKVEQLNSAYKTLLQHIAQVSLEAIMKEVGQVEDPAKWAAEAPERFEKAQRASEDLGNSLVDLNAAGAQLNETQAVLEAMFEDQYVDADRLSGMISRLAKAHQGLAEYTGESERATHGAATWMDTADKSALGLAVALAEITTKCARMSKELGIAAKYTEGLPVSLAKTAAAFIDASRDGETLWGTLGKIATEAEEVERHLWDMSTSMTDYFRDTARSAEQYAEDREGIEQGHQDRLAELEKRGMATRVYLDVEEHEAKLAQLKRNLEIALQEQSQYTDKTAQSTRMRKDDQIASLQAQIAEETKLIDDYHAGRLWKAGENVKELIGKENERYAEEMRMLEQNRKDQEAEQRRSLGRMLLQHFEAWGTMQGLTADQMMEMRLNISEEYGLITTEGAKAARNQIKDWALYFKLGKAGWDDLETKRARYYENLKPKTVDIRIRTIHETIGQASPGATIPQITAQRGFQGMVGPGFGGPKRILAGEVPEYVSITPLGAGGPLVRPPRVIEEPTGPQWLEPLPPPLQPTTVPRQLRAKATIAELMEAGFFPSLRGYGGMGWGGGDTFYQEFYIYGADYGDVRELADEIVRLQRVDGVRQVVNLT